jgi:hypothetical protein
MRTASLALQPASAGPGADEPGGVESLVRRLLGHLAAHPAAGYDDEPQILLDVEVDGVRCVLQRVAPRGRSEVPLSPREREIARMVARGYPNKALPASWRSAPGPSAHTCGGFLPSSGRARARPWWPG